MDNGILNFHYSRDKSKESDNQAILSSGFLSAIVSFSKEARSDTIDSFSTGSELIIFSNVEHTGKQLACVFSKETQQEIAYYITTQIKEELLNTGFVRETKSNLATEEKFKFRQKIEQIEQKFIGSKNQIEYLSSHIKGFPSVNLAILFNQQKKEKVMHHATPESFFNKEFVKDFQLLITTINNSLSKLKLGERFSSIIINSKDYEFSIKANEIFASLVFGKTEDNDLLSELSSMMISILGEHKRKDVKSLHATKKAILDQHGKLKFVGDEKFPAMAEVFFSLITNNINRIFTKISTKKFRNCQITTVNGSKILIRRINSTEEFEISIKLEQ